MLTGSCVKRLAPIANVLIQNKILFSFEKQTGRHKINNINALPDSLLYFLLLQVKDHNLKLNYLRISVFNAT